MVNLTVCTVRNVLKTHFMKQNISVGNSACLFPQDKSHKSYLMNQTALCVPGFLADV